MAESESQFELHAWGDESARSAGLESPAYLLGAVVADPADCEKYRDEMRGLQTTRSKVHWRELDRKHRDQVIATLAGFDVFHVVVVGTPMEPRKPERARAKCLEHLAWQLNEQHHVTQLILEARPQSLMRKDLQTIDSLRGRNGLPRGLRVDHGLPLAEPMLWVTDQVLGAVGESMAGEAGWYDVIADAVDIVRIDL